MLNILARAGLTVKLILMSQPINYVTLSKITYVVYFNKTLSEFQVHSRI